MNASPTPDTPGQAAEIRENGEVCRIFIEQMEEGAITLSHEGVILSCNPAFARITRRPTDQLCGVRFDSLVAPPDQPTWSRLFAEALQGHAFGELEIADDNGWIPLRVSMTPLPAGTRGRVCVVATDITDLRKKEDALRRMYAEMDVMVAKRTAALSETLKELELARSAAFNMMEDAIEAKEKAEIANIELEQEVQHRTRAEERLSKSEARFRALFDQSPVSIIIHDAESGEILEANQAALDSYGYQDRGQLSLASIWLEEEPFTFARMKELLARAREEGRQVFEWKNRRADGDVFWETVTLQRMIIGGETRILASSVDITKQKRQELRLETMRKRAEAQLRFPALLEELGEKEFMQHAQEVTEDLTRSKISFIHFVNEAEGTIELVTWSRRTLHHYCTAAYDNHYPIAKAGIWADGIRSRKPIVVNDYAAHPVKSGLPHGHAHLERFVSVPVFEAGKVVMLAGVGNKDENYDDLDVETVQTFANAIWTLVQRKRGMKALNESRERLQTVITASKTGVWEYHGDTDFVWSSAEYFTMLGHDPNQFRMDGTPNLQENWVALLHPDDREQSVARFSAYLQGGSVGMYENHFRMRHSDGSWRWIWSRGKTLRDAEGKLTSVTAGTIFDVTELKRTQQEKEQLLLQLTQAQKMESVGRLAGGIAHDFNNMLAVILGRVELVQDQLEQDQPLHAELEEIRKAAQRSADLTRQLLAFARKQTVAPKVLDLNETVEGMLKMLRRLIGEDVELVWKPGRHLGKVYLDPSQVDQILANLCVNARDAIEGTGLITIETGNETIGEPHGSSITSVRPGEYVTLSVTDDGCGMDVATLNQLFEPFFTTKPVGKGTGLGLATVYGVVQQNRGFIDVRSKPGQGSTFLIRFPRHLATEAMAPDQTRTKDPLTEKATILLVEDEAPILKITQLVLESLGHRVIAAVSPSEAILVAREQEHGIDLLLTDVIMPAMNGRDLSELLAQSHPGMRTLYMSGYTADIISNHGVLADGVAFIQKPFTKKELSAKIQSLLATKPA